MKLALASLAAVAALSFATTATAAVVVGPSINGFGTFTDTNTGKNWVKLDSFFDKTHNQMASSVTGAGFTVAVRSEVETLLNSLPLDAGQWAGYKAIMGGAPNRDEIWGSYGPVDGQNQVGWAFAGPSDPAWDFLDFIQDADTVPNGGAFADMNIWAFSGGSAPIPEPATWALLITGFGLVGFTARRRAAIA